MAYFIPTYFQKRLLRYALSRLDFIDSDALDLDDLGFTVGQRSVIELKNVAIRVHKLVERFELPATVLPRHASIQRLRITVPADLHVSGIEVEIDGIDIEAELDETRREDATRNRRSKAGKAPSHTDIANRPRLASNAPHDPGGSGHHGIDASHLLPAPEDLAASFLEAEPQRERQELEAALQSRSSYLPQSSSSIEGSVSEDGTGVPEGFSLPGFVTNFFEGIADRLSVVLRQIAVSLTVSVGTDQTAGEALQFMLKFEEIELQTLKPQGEAKDPDLRRRIRIVGVELLLISDSDILTQKSTPASPKLSRSRSALAASSRQSSPENLRGFPDRFPSLGSSESGSVPSTGTPHFGFEVQDSMLESSQVFGSTVGGGYYSPASDSPGVEHPPPIQNIESTPPKDGSRSTSPASSQNSASFHSDHGDLAESKVFSHHEAESMYMSAFSEDKSRMGLMPGGFDLPSTVSRVQETGDAARTSAASLTTLRPAQRELEPKPEPEQLENREREREIPSQPQTSEEVLRPQSGPSVSSNDCIKRIFRVNEMNLQIPTKRRSPDTTEPEPVTMPRKTFPPPRDRDARLSASRIAQSASHARLPSDHSIYGGVPQGHAVALDRAQSYEVLIGDVELSVDIGLCQVLLKASTKLNKIFDTPKSSPDSHSTRQNDLQLRTSINSIVFNIMEIVPEVKDAVDIRMPTESTFSVRGVETPLLQLQILQAVTELARANGRFDQKSTIHRLGLYRQADKILNFYDTSALQESFASSSVMVGPHDIVIEQANERVEITTKPLHLMLDLLVVDDVLSRSGGLSSLLDLRASVASAETVKDRSSSATTRRRSVRFDDPKPSSRADQPQEQGMKLNMRVEGSVIDLVGSESSIQIKTSAIKLAKRQMYLRTNVSGVSIRGPIVEDFRANDGLNIRLGDLSLQYLDTPTEEDLDRLLQLLAPSNDKYENDDDIMVETLLRQRRKGGVIRVSMQEIQVSAHGIAWTQRLSKLGEEISKLSTVTKYLPEDDRPGILSFILVNKINLRFELNKQYAPLVLKLNIFEGAHITIPSLMAAQISHLTLTKGQDQPLIHELIPSMQESVLMGPPMLMCRFIPDEMEPTIKLKVSHTSFEYSVPLLLAITQFVEAVQQDMAKVQQPSSPRASEISTASEASDLARKIKLSLAFRSSALSLSPLNSTACGLFLLTDAVIGHSTKRDTILTSFEIDKASIMIIDDVAKIGSEASSADPKLYFDQNDTLQELVKVGFVPVGSISAASAHVKIFEDHLTSKQSVDVEFRNNLLFLETCADSTQTLIEIMGGLSPPTPPSKQERYRTQVVPIEDMLASFTGNAFVSEKGPELGLQIDPGENTPTPSAFLEPSAEADLAGALGEDEDDQTFMHDLYTSEKEILEQENMSQSTLLSRSSHSNVGGASVHIAPVNITADDDSPPSGSIMMHSLIDFRKNHFVEDTSNVGGTAHRWDSIQNTYGMGSELSAQQSPLTVRVRDVHIIWNLFDGYDWQNTRDVISQAVRDVEDKALARQRRRESHRSPGPDDEDESVVGDVLFNSIYISIPTNRDPRDLTNAINAELGDATSETGSYATSTTITAATSKRSSNPRMKPKKLKLNRSKQHKMTFELEGLAVDFLAFPSGTGEIESSVDIRVSKLDIFDHIPTSTWKKFATYMYESGDREVDRDQVHIELLNVKPIAELSASEMVLKVTVLPLRLHVDQDALDFLTRFFEFKDDRAVPSGAPSNPPFLQRVEVNPIKVRLDFKPKRVDYAGLKSGRTTEFMNFFILDRADMVLRRVILYGVSGFDRLGIMLNNIWTPDVRNNQLPTVLAGLAPVRSLVDVGSGVRDLIAVPIREYKKDGRIVRSIQKGALAFAKTTSTELVNLGAKLAIGTQTVLQNAEDVLAPQNRQRPPQTASSDSSDDEQPHAISHYADQPLGIIQGLRGAYASLERDLLLAKDAIVAVPGEIMAEGSATGAAKVVLKSSPTIILRPAIGVSKAVGTALLGAGNTLDKGNRRRIEDKYKRHY